MLLYPIVVTAAITATACGPQYRTEPIGSAALTQSASSVAAVVNVGASPDDLMVQYSVNTPVAMALRYSISCPASFEPTQITGTIGVSFEDYRRRRLAELRNERRRQVNRTSQLTRAIVGQVGAKGSVQTPTGQAQGEVQVDGAAVGNIVGQATTPDVANELPAWDVGAQTLSSKARFRGSNDGQCVLRLEALNPQQDMSGVTGTLWINRAIDIASEGQRNSASADRAALEFRATLRANLIARGADPTLRARRQQAQQDEQAARDVAAQKIVVEVAAVETQKRRVTLQVEVASQSAALITRRRLVAWQLSRGADLGYQARIRQERYNQEQSAITTQRATSDGLRAGALSTRQRLIAWQISHGADRRYRAQIEVQALVDQNIAQQQEQATIMALTDLHERQRLNDMTTRRSLVTSLIAQGGDLDFRRKQNEADLRSFEARSQAARVQVQVPTLAQPRPRPQAPRPPQEVRSPHPGGDVKWVVGSYHWQATGWVWTPGTWVSISVPFQLPTLPVKIDINLGGHSKPPKTRRRHNRGH